MHSTKCAVPKYRMRSTEREVPITQYRMPICLTLSPNERGCKMTILELCCRWPNRLVATMFAIGLGMAAVHGADAAPIEGYPLRAATSDVIPPLFTPFIAGVKEKMDEVAAPGPQVVRLRRVDIDRNVLTQAAAAVPKAFGQGAATSIAVGKSITLNLFEDVTFIADSDSIERTARGTTWIGHLRDIEHGQVILVVNDDVVVGNISLPAARYHIRYAGNGAHEVQEIDPSKFPVDERSVPVPPKIPVPESRSAPDPKAQADDGSVIDVMVIYSTTTRTAAGGTTAMRAEIDLGIAETNQSYFNSGILHRVRLVHADEVSYTETGVLGDALDCITELADGCLDGIHALRDLYAADLVSLWVEKGDACGIGWWDAPSVAAAHGFSVVDRSCATGTYSFGHELGHNMGAHHDVYVKPATAGNPYGHGYVNLSAGWRTVMAYDDACVAAGKKCHRIQYWSNPAFRYSGAALGDASADNHRILNASAGTVANFRTNTFVAPPPPAGGGNFIVNPGFESGPGGWFQSTADLIWNDSQNSHSGRWAAWLGYVNNADHLVYQDIAIPANAQSASLQFWYRIITNETTNNTAYDFGMVDVVNPITGAVLLNLGTLSNLNATNGWVQSTPANLLAYKGSTVRLRFRATTDENKGTSFFFDDVALTVALPAVTATVIEFYNTNLDNYFITSNGAEAAAIDGGSAGPGWGRTGNLFNFNAGGDTPVCRFYGGIAPGPNSHFYTVSTAECNALKALQATTPASQPRWNFEGLDFVSAVPANGACPAGKTPVYRAYNNGLTRRVDSNHRITTNQAGIAAVVARGWVNEGVVMCAPQ